MNVVLLGMTVIAWLPPSPERCRNLLAKLEEPTRHVEDEEDGPPKGVAPNFNYRFHFAEIFQLTKAGKAVRPAVLALLANHEKPGQARAHAGIIVIDWLKGTGANQELDKELLVALKDALQDKNAALKWGILQWLPRYGAAHARANYPLIAKLAPEKPLDSMHFSAAVMDGLLTEILPLLAEEEVEIAEEAATTIYAFGQPKQGVKELLAALERQEVRVRLSAIQALSRVGRDDPVVLKAILGQLKPEHYRFRYSTVVEAVACFGPKAKDAVPALIAVLKDDQAKKTQLSATSSFYDSAYLYSAALTALGEIGPEAKAAVPAILERMRDPVVARDALQTVISALEKIDPEAAKEALTFKKQREDDSKKKFNPSRPRP
jgi:HEAT repeat protein